MPAPSTESGSVQPIPSSWWRDLVGTIARANKPFPIAGFYLALLTLIEVLAVFRSPQVGQALYLLILFLLLLHTSLTWERPIHRFLLSLAFVPLIRVISLALPLARFPLISWYLIVSIPLFAAAYVVIRLLKLRPWNGAGYGRGWLPQLAFAPTGILFGTIEYLILQPEPLVSITSWQELLIAAVILLICTGLLEELIFRGIMQRTAVEQLGRLWGIVYVAIIFAMLHLGYGSLPDILVVLAIGLLFGWFVARTGSLLGVTLSHGLTNITLFLIIPFWLSAGGQA